jgi:murein DD-endopeptidase MepM/ murein hydrolase activator NlpD
MRVWGPVVALIVAVATAVSSGDAAAQSHRARPKRPVATKAAPARLSTVSTTPARGELAIEVRSRGIRPGEVLEVTIASPVALTGVTATLGRRAFPLWPVTPTSWRGLAGLDVDQEPGAIAIVAGGTRASGPPLSRTLALTVGPATFPERRLTVAPKFVEPPASERPRIEREARELHAIYDHASADRIPGPFVVPVSHRRSSSFGRRSVFNGQPRERHAGLDFASPANAAIHAPAAGTVTLVAPLYFTGNTVVIDHGQGLYSILAHMTEASVKVGQVVAPGDVVGRVGATGRVTGPHLHWSVRLGGARVDPAAVLELLARTSGERPAPSPARR